MPAVLKRDILVPLIFLLSFIRDDIVGYDANNTVSDPMYVNGILMLLQASIYWCLFGTGVFSLLALWLASVFELNDAHVLVPLTYFIVGMILYLLKSALGAFFHYSFLVSNITYVWEQIPEYSPIDPTIKLRWFNASFQEPPRWIIWGSWIFACFHMYREANKEVQHRRMEKSAAIELSKIIKHRPRHIRTN